MENLNTRFLIDLDVLLDTRLATVAKLSPEAATRIMADPKYLNRELDDFYIDQPEFTAQEYLDAWKHRDKLTAAMATPTVAVGHIHQMLLGDMRDPSFNFEDRTISIDINIWPYKFTQEERSEMLDIMEKQLFPGPFKHGVVRFSPEELTPTTIIANLFTNIYMYDLSGWLEYHRDALDRQQIPSVTMVGPAILREPVDYSKVPAIHRRQLEAMGPFRAAEFLAVPYADLHFTKAGHFCSALIPRHKEGP